jgi:hypothetical protein
MGHSRTLAQSAVTQPAVSALILCGREASAVEDADALFVSGCAPNQGKSYGQFDHVVLLTAPAAVIAKRLGTRTNNSFGKDAGQLARTLLLQEEVERLPRRGADLEVDTTAPLDEVIATILQHVDGEAVLG